METKEKRVLTPEEREERRRRMEAKKRRQEAEKRKKQKRLLLIGGIAAAVVIVLLAVFAVVKIAGRPKELSAKGDNFVMVIDPGHGGEDIGMSRDSVLEKEVTMDICSKLKIMLEGQGYEVIMTRNDDTRMSKEERVAAANSTEADLLVSVHCSYSKDNTFSGAASHYKADSKESAYLAENIQAALIKETGAEDLGFAEGSYTIITDTEMPAVLVEVGYLSNTQETDALAQDSYQNDTAKGIAKGIILSLNRSE